MIIPNIWKVIKLYKIPWFQSPPTSYQRTGQNETAVPSFPSPPVLRTGHGVFWRGICWTDSPRKTRPAKTYKKRSGKMVNPFTWVIKCPHGSHHPTMNGIWSTRWLLWLVMSFIFPKWDGYQALIYFVSFPMNSMGGSFHSSVNVYQRVGWFLGVLYFQTHPVKSSEITRWKFSAIWLWWLDNRKGTESHWWHVMPLEFSIGAVQTKRTAKTNVSRRGVFLQAPLLVELPLVWATFASFVCMAAFLLFDRYIIGILALLLFWKQVLSWISLLMNGWLLW